MDESNEEKVIRFDLFRDNFQYAFNQLDETYKNNSNVKFFFDEDWNLLANLNGESIYFAPNKRIWLKVL